MQEGSNRMKRGIAAAQTFDEANDHVSYWSDKTPDERLNPACFIINRIFGVTPQTKVDRSVVHQRKHA